MDEGMFSCLSLGIEMPLSFSFRIRDPVSKLSWSPDEILGFTEEEERVSNQRHIYDRFVSFGL